MTEREYRVEVSKELLSDGTVVYEAWHPELRGCRSHGETPEEAVENLADARAMYLEALAENETDEAAQRRTG